METTVTHPKKDHWNNYLHSLREKGLDKGILETVTALNLLGIETSKSCEGRLAGFKKEGFSDIYPSVMVSSNFKKIPQFRSKLVELLDEHYGYEERVGHMYCVSHASDDLPALVPVCLEKILQERGGISKIPKFWNLMDKNEQIFIHNETRKQMKKITEFLKQKYLLGE